jgi:hypothetical protein
MRFKCFKCVNRGFRVFRHSAEQRAAEGGQSQAFFPLVLTITLTLIGNPPFRHSADCHNLTLWYILKIDINKIYILCYFISEISLIILYILYICRLVQFSDMSYDI